MLTLDILLRQENVITELLATVMQPASPRQQLLEAIAELSNRQLQAVLRFVQTLPPKSVSTPSDETPDRLTDFIRGSHHGSLAQTIDKTLYK